MFLFYTSFIFSYYSNGLGKSFKKTVKHVTKPVEKVTKKVVTETTHFIDHKSTSTQNKPLEFSSFSKSNKDDSFLYNQQSNFLDELYNLYGVDKNQLNSFLNIAKFSTQSKKLLNNFKMDILSDPRWRTAKLNSYLFSSNKNMDGSISIKVKSITSSCNILVQIVEETKSKQLGGLASHSKSSHIWRPLIESELNQVFNTVKDKIQSEILSLK